MSQYPLIAAGAPLTGNLLRAMLTQDVVKQATTSRASDITVDDDPELAFPVLAGATYEATAYLFISGQTTAGFRSSWAVPAGTTGNRRVDGPGSAASQTDADNIAVRRGVHLMSSEIVYSNVRNSGSLHVEVFERFRIAIAATAGDVTLRWAQGASSATATNLNADSYIQYRRVG